MFKVIWFIGAWLRNPSLFKIYKELKISEKYSKSKLNDIQFRKLKNILIFAYENSNFYKKKFKEKSFNPRKDFKSVEDINKVPIISKNDLLIFNDEIQVNNENKTKKLFLAESSGTTGQKLKFFRDEFSDSFNRASIMRGYSWHGVNIWDRNGYFWGYSFSLLGMIKTKFLDFLQNRFRVFSYTENEINSFIKKLKKAKYLSGYSSMIYEVAKKINDSDQITNTSSLKMIKGTSEKIFDKYRSEVYKAFGVNIISEYGAAEVGIIAFECKYKNMHLNTEGVFVEEIDNQIIITNLITKSFPVIRYKLGDYIELDKTNIKCKCGLNHPIINEVIGRIGKPVYGFKNIYPSLIFYNIFKNLSKEDKLELNYQVIQESKGHIRVNIEQKIGNTERIEIIKQIKRYFKNDIQIEIFDKIKLHLKKQKLTDFISNIKDEE